MSNLSPDLQRLVAAGRDTDQLTNADRDRLFTALQGRLGLDAGITSGAMGATVAQSSAHALVMKSIAIATATLALLTGGFRLVQSMRDNPPPSALSPANSAVASAREVTSATAPVEPPVASAMASPEAAPTPAESKATSPNASARGSGRPHDSLSEEVAILSRAQAALHGGRTDDALRLLAEHERKFSRGILVEERTATKVQALCALGRDTEANALIGKLSARSLTGDSARQACTSNKKAAPAR